ncbi:SCO-spondin-like [Tubulanus polymorphus]|uniref:SCO-spondin-like n=1 Tax=Tubulanus polymorphus TaxID=672921 RepID=UPI003DA51A2E
MDGVPYHLIGLIILTVLTSNSQSLDENKCKVTKQHNDEHNAKCSDYFAQTIAGYNIDLAASPALQGLTATQREAKLEQLMKANDQTSICKFIKVVSTEIEECCPGWGGSQCDRPVCNPACQNGVCTGPYECTCSSGYFGKVCEYDSTLSTDNNRFCFKDKDCDGDPINSTVTTHEQCCKEGLSWGGGGQLCDECSTTSVVEKKHDLNFATCLSYGRSNYRTFDGWEYQYGGMCAYTMVKYRDIWYCKMRLKDAYHYSTLTKEIECKFEENLIWVLQEDVVKFGPDRNNLETKSETTFKHRGVTVEKKGDMMYLQSTRIRVKWSRDTAYFTVDDTVTGLEGLCGNNDGDPINDIGNFRTVADFGNNYKSRGECPNAGNVGNSCTSTEEDDAATEHCRPITRRFASCRPYVSLQNWFKRCKIDYCNAMKDADDADGPELVICTTLAALAQECVVESDGAIQVSWRTSSLCPKKCPEGMKYTEFMSTCRRTCANFYDPHLLSRPECKEVVSGCKCKSGTFLDFKDDKATCIQGELCPCFSNKKRYESGEYKFVDCNKCECFGGRWSCTKKSCDRTCFLVNDHVFPFSRFPYAMKGGDCEFIAVEPISSEDPRDNLNIRVKGECADGQDYMCNKKLVIDYMEKNIVMEKECKLTVNGVEHPLPYHDNSLYMRGVCVIANAENERFVPRGQSVPDGESTFLTSYRTPTTCTASQFPTELIEDACGGDATKKAEAQSQCQILVSEDGPFSDCKDSLIEGLSSYYDLCVSEICLSTGDGTEKLESRCTAIATAAQACANAGVVINWLRGMSSFECPSIPMYSCDSGTSYVECSDSCKSNCRDMQVTSRCRKKKLQCIPGCRCENNQLKDDYNLCVDVKDCTCYNKYDQTDPIKDAGSTIKRGCTECICLERQWKVLGDPTQKCPGVCSATGDPHFITFDKKAFSFEGMCMYTFARTKEGIQPSFDITTENVQCGTSGVTCTKSTILTFGSNRIHLLRGTSVQVNDQILDGSDVNYSTEDMEIYKAGLFTTVYVKSLKLTIRWDGSTRVYAFLDPMWQDKVEGLCGNYNNNPNDDFESKSGGLETAPHTFADSWSMDCPVGSDTPSIIGDSEPCAGVEHRESWARESCAVLMDENGPFAECLRRVPNTDLFHKHCIFDSCRCDQGGDCECLCTAIAALSEYCRQAGIHSIKWRSQRLCHETCVPAKKCPCYHNGVPYPAGTVITADCQNCTCTNGKFDCVGKPCAEKTCPPDKFVCESGQCIDPEWRCDQAEDCGDGSDEKDCITTCKPDEFQCMAGMCIDNSHVCDGVPDCMDSSDEQQNCTYCPEGLFTCANRKCIPLKFKCDGTDDCGDNSEEKNCTGY